MRSRVRRFAPKTYTVTVLYDNAVTYRTRAGYVLVYVDVGIGIGIM